MSGAPTAPTQICIPTFNRPAFCGRTLLYLESCGFGGEVHLADGSSDRRCRDEMDVLVDRFSKSLTIAYRHYDESWSMIDRWTDLIAQAPGPDLILCADDDLVAPAAADACVRFLAETPACAIAHGPGMVVRSAGPALGTLFSQARTTPYLQAHLTQEDGIERFEAHCARYSSQAYSAQRRDQLLERFRIWKIICPGPYVRIADTLNSCISALHGTWNQLPVSYICRQGHTASGHATHTAWSDEVTTELFFEAFERAVAVLHDHLPMGPQRDRGLRAFFRLVDELGDHRLSPATAAMDSHAPGWREPHPGAGTASASLAVIDERESLSALEASDGESYDQLLRAVDFIRQFPRGIPASR
jgi:glycosyltransferase domain-containing protein